MSIQYYLMETEVEENEATILADFKEVSQYTYVGPWLCVQSIIIVTLVQYKLTTTQHLAKLFYKRKKLWTVQVCGIVNRIKSRQN